MSAQVSHPFSPARPLSTVWPAAAAIADHVMMCVVRDTRACGLSENDSFNRFPATPFCCLTWMLEGQARLVSQGGQPRGQMLPRIMLSGCQSRYGVSQNIGERHSFMVVFFPDAFHHLFGLDLSQLQDKFVDAELLFDDKGQSLLQEVAKAKSNEERCRLLSAYVETHGQALALSPWPRLRRLGQNLSLRLATGLLGVGERQVQRLVKREAGLPLLGLSRLWRAKRSHAQIHEKLARGQPPDWADHACQHGYADQSHLVRECRQITGRSPQQLLNDAQKNESDWMYRLW